jgi:hypothetical protein
VGSFEYNALNFDYLSISGAKAQFKGTGKIIGGQSGINFIMTVIDGALDGTGIDKARIKIYNKNTGKIYYDNEPGTSDAAIPVTQVGENSQVVISGSSAVLTRAVPITEQTIEVEPLALSALPNPTTSDYTLFITGGYKKEPINLQVFDLSGRLIETQKTYSGSKLKIGELYRPGVYFARIYQGTEQRQIKLMKVPD